MPYVHIRNAGSLSKKQKEELATKITSVMSDVTSKPPEATYVVIEEVPRENWAVGGSLLADTDAKNKS